MPCIRALRTCHQATRFASPADTDKVLPLGAPSLLQNAQSAYPLVLFSCSATAERSARAALCFRPLQRVHPKDFPLLPFFCIISRMSFNAYRRRTRRHIMVRTAGNNSATISVTSRLVHMCLCLQGRSNTRSSSAVRSSFAVTVRLMLSGVPGVASSLIHEVKKAPATSGAQSLCDGYRWFCDCSSSARVRGSAE